MSKLVGDTRPTKIAGEAVFTSYDGLRVEANGVLAFLTFDQRLVEMRNAELLEVLPAYSTGESCMFVQEVIVEQKKYWIIGLVKKIKDYSKRPGILGCCVCTHHAEDNLDDIRGYLYDVLQTSVDDTFEDMWKGRPLPKQLNILQNVPRNEYQPSYQTQQGSEMAFSTDEVGQDAAVNAVKLRVQYTQNLGKVFLFNNATSGARPVDRIFVEAATEQAKKTKETARQHTHQAQERQRQTLPKAQEERDAQRAAKFTPENVANGVRQTAVRTSQLEPVRSISSDAVLYSSDAEGSITLKSLFEDLQHLNRRVMALETIRDLAGTTLTARQLPIDKIMRSKKKKAPEVIDKIILVSGISLAGLLVFGIVIYIALKMFQSDDPAPQVKITQEQTETPLAETPPETFQGLTTIVTPQESDNQRSIIPAPDAPPESADVLEVTDCSTLGTYAEQTKCQTNSRNRE